MDKIVLPGAGEHPPALNDAILLFLSDKLVDGIPPMQIVYAAYEARGWLIEDVAAFEALGEQGQRAAVKAHIVGKTPSPTVRKLPQQRRRIRTRQDRLKKRRHVPGLRFVRRMSIDPIQDGRLSDGAVRTLALLVSRCARPRIGSLRTAPSARARSSTTTPCFKTLGTL